MKISDATKYLMVVAIEANLREDGNTVALTDRILRDLKQIHPSYHEIGEDEETKEVVQELPNADSTEEKVIEPAASVTTSKINKIIG